MGYISKGMGNVREASGTKIVNTVYCILIHTGKGERANQREG
jgi:hypothetical protein